MQTPDALSTGIIVGFGGLLLAASKSFSRIFRLSNTTLEKDLKRVIEERDKERKEKFEEQTKRVAAELALHIAMIDFDGFLQKKGIDPKEFRLSEAKKIEQVAPLIVKPEDE